MLLLCVLSLLVMSIAVIVMVGTTTDEFLDGIKKTRFIVAVTSLLGTTTIVLTGEEMLHLTRSNTFKASIKMAFKIEVVCS